MITIDPTPDDWRQAAEEWRLAAYRATERAKAAEGELAIARGLLDRYRAAVGPLATVERERRNGT